VPASNFLSISLPQNSTTLEFTFSGYDKLKALEVGGHLTDRRLAKLLSFTPYLQTLKLELTSKFKLENAHSIDFVDHDNLRETIVEELGDENRDGLYIDYLSRAHLQLEAIRFFNIVVQENSPHIRNFLRQNQMTLKRLYITNGTFARNTTIFVGLSLHKLGLAVIDINQEHFDTLPDNLLDDFSKAFPYLTEIYSNTRCSKAQTISVLQNWK